MKQPKKKTISAWGKFSKMKTIDNNKVQNKQGGHLQTTPRNYFNYFFAHINGESLCDHQ